ncbi:unnamed protein product [Ectocarpus sp. 8 AP-2014]
MDNIVIDRVTGDVVVKTMIKHIMRGLNDNTILKSVHRVLKDHRDPKMSSRPINGRLTSVATLGLCYDMFENMARPKWRLWREESGQAFKRALRERVESVRSGHEEQLQSRRQREQSVVSVEQVEPVEPVETKSSALQKALRSINIVGSVRIHEDPGKRPPSSIPHASSVRKPLANMLHRC